jgi:hypothetical protein
MQNIFLNIQIDAKIIIVPAVFKNIANISGEKWAELQNSDHNIGP